MEGMGTALTAALKAPVEDATEVLSRENFDQIIRQHQRRVYRVIFLLVRDPEAADSLTQDCFLRAYQNRSNFRGDSRLETWLLRIAVNLVRDHVKNRRVSFWKRLVGLGQDNNGTGPNIALVPAPQPSAERVLLAREGLQAVWNVVRSLPEQQRTVFLLRFGEEMSLAEIAETLRVSVGSVKSQLSRATARVRATRKEKS
jgi:RNA polymerase sigma-70 factor, ECF subfamily